MMKNVLRVAVALVVVATGCSSRDLSEVSLDLSPLRAQAALGGPTLDRLAVIVSAADLPESLRIDVGAGDVFRAEIPAGPQRVFTLDAARFVGEARFEVPVFLGAISSDLPAGGEVDLTLPAYASGLVRAPVEALFATLPATLPATLVAAAPPIDRPSETIFDVSAGELVVPLPVGSYHVSASFTDPSGELFSLASDEQVVVRHGELTQSPLFLFRAADKCKGAAPAAVLDAAPVCRRVSVSVVGLTAPALTVQLNGGATLSFSADGTQSFTDGIADGGVFEITLGASPRGLACELQNGAGVVAGTDVVVSVACAPLRIPIEVVVAGLAGGTLVLHSGADRLDLTADGSYSFATPVLYGDPYSVALDPVTVGNCVAYGTRGTATGAIQVQVVCVGDVRPLYAAAPNWNDYVLARDVTAPCPAAELGPYDGCLHGGERRAIELHDLTSCAGVSATDALGVFTWTCDASQGFVTVRSTGLAVGKGLVDLVDGTPAFKLDSVFVDVAGVTRQSKAGIWWSNPVVGSAAQPPPGTIVVVAASVDASTWGLTSQGLAVVVLPGATVSSFAPVQLAGPFAWAEGAFATSMTSGSVLSVSGPRSVLRHVRTSTTALDPSIWLMASGLLLTSVDVSGPGILVDASAPDATLRTVKVTGGGITVSADRVRIDGATVLGSSGSGLLVAGTGGGVLRHIDVADSAGYGVEITAPATSLAHARLAHNSTGGLRLAGGGAPIAGDVVWDVVASDNMGDGVQVFMAQELSLGGVTAVNNGMSGLTIDGLTSGLITSVLAANSGQRGVAMSNSSDVVLASIAAVANVTEGVYLWNGDRNVLFDIAAISDDVGVSTYAAGTPPAFHGRLLLGGNVTANCSDGLANTFFANCTASGAEGTSDYPGASTAVLGVGRSVAAAFLGKVLVDDVINPLDVGGAAPLLTVFAASDWLYFESPYRAWMPDGVAALFPDATQRGPASIDLASRIFDWRAAIGGALTAVVAAPVATVTFTLTSVGGSSQVGLAGAIEIVDDGLGDDDLVCENGESCVVGPNLGSYQGEGALTAAGTVNGSTLQICATTAH